MASWDDELRFAIANKRLLRCTYDTRSRIAEPHDYGLLHGVAKLLVYQIRGGRSPLQGGGFFSHCEDGSTAAVQSDR